MEWFVGGEWLQDRSVAVLVSTDGTRAITLSDEVVTRVVEHSARIPADMELPPPLRQHGPTVWLDFGARPEPPDASLEPLFGFLRAFGPLDMPTSHEGQRVSLRDLHAGLLTVGGVWRQLQAAFAEPNSRRRRSARLACQERVLELIEEQFTGDVSSDFFAGKRASIRPVIDGSGFDLRVTVAPVTLEGRLWLWLLERVRVDPVRARCKRPGCLQTFDVQSLRGRPPRYCLEHRSERDYMARLRAERKNPVIHRPAVDEINEQE